MSTINTITVTGTYKDLLGRAGSGVVQFVPDTDIFEDATDEIIYTKQIFSARLDAYGKLKAKVPVTDVGNLTPVSFRYTIIEKVTGMKRRTTSSVAIPSSYGETVSITQLI